MSKYDESSIITAEKLEHLRIRPTGYVMDTEIAGQWHVTKELIDNSIDELELLGDKGLLTVCLCRDVRDGNYQMIVTDNGRGIPLGTLLNVFTVLHTSGKFNTDAYMVSSGSFGIGAKVPAGLSKYFRALSFRKDGVGDLVVKNAKAPDNIVVLKEDIGKRGTLAIYEPDPLIFSHIKEFSEGGFNTVIELLQKFSLFSKYRIQFKMSNNPLPMGFWDYPTKDAIVVLESVLEKADTIYDNFIDQKDNDAYIKNYFNVMRPWSWKQYISKSIHEDKKLGFDILIYGTKYEPTGGHLALINSVPIDDPKSSHIVQFYNTMKRCMAVHIGDKDMRDYFLSYYKLPLFVAMSIKYSGAEFTGTTKHAFSDSQFSLLFGKELTKLLTSNGMKSKLQELYQLLAEDIESKYILFTTGSTKVKATSKQLLLSLNYPDKFSDCNINGAESELFLTEGDSANSNEGRDSEYQASYSLRGKPLNVITNSNNIQQSMLSVKKNAIFSDIVNILALSPTQTTFDNLRYGKVFIMADADSHGKHICNIILGGLYAYNPTFVESGRVYIVTPPFYGLRLKGKKSQTIYIHTVDEFINNLADSVYYKALDIKIYSPNVFDSGRSLNIEEFVEFCRIVNHVGDMITRLSKEHVIHPLILEQLTYVTYYLTPETMNIDHIREVFDNPNITYDPENNILTMSIGRDDIIISLNGLASSLYKEVLPFLRKIEWTKLGILVSTKYSDLYKDQPMSMVQLYQVFSSLNDLFEIERYKGLANMFPVDRARTCMDPRHRKVYQVTTMGDVDRMFQLMGNDSSYRKQLLETTTKF